MTKMRPLSSGRRLRLFIPPIFAALWNYVSPFRTRCAAFLGSHQQHARQAVPRLSLAADDCRPDLFPRLASVCLSCLISDTVGVSERLRRPVAERRKDVSASFLRTPGIAFVTSRRGGLLRLPSVFRLYALFAVAKRKTLCLAYPSPSAAVFLPF